jgi:Ni,Fe-hydrogenase III large subunit
MSIDTNRHITPTGLPDRVAAALAAGARFAGLYATATHTDGDPLRLTTLLANDGRLSTIDTSIRHDGYASLTATAPAAFWYERVIHDLFGVAAHGHPRLDPLVLPLPDGTPRPRPGAPGRPPLMTPDEHTLTRHVLGTGLFTIPHGPVRSGVMESVEYLVETPGEDIPYLRLRPYYKHRGVEKTFETFAVADGIRVAERVEGIATIAHATAYAHGIESLAGAAPPPSAEYVRVIHAELERIANHLDVMLRLSDAAGLAVATARFGWHKERVLRLIGSACGSRFGRGVVICGGVSAPPRLTRSELRTELANIGATLQPDMRLLMRTSSFLDRLRGTGPLPPQTAEAHGAVGPIARASGITEDTRTTGGGYGAYPLLEMRRADGFDTGDALARLAVRVAEVDESMRLVDTAADRLEIGGPLSCPIEAADGRGFGRAEAPQGELIYAVDVHDQRITRCWPRTASFHNLALFGSVFTGDILTDFPFIEASFGTSIAGVAL